MTGKRAVLLLIAVYITILIVPSACAKVLSESTFKELGYETVAAEKKFCQKYEFSTEALPKEASFVISLHADFLPIEDREAYIELLVNKIKIGEFYPSDFRSGWVRAAVEDKSVLAANNTIQVCFTPSQTSLKIVLYNDSKFGAYLMPYFYREGAFTKEVSKQEPYIGEEFEVFITLKNYGSEDAEVEINYSKEDIEKVYPYLNVLKGELEKRATIAKCAAYNASGCIQPGIVSIQHTVKSEKAIRFMLLPAVVKFKDAVSGEETALESNKLFMNVKKPELRLEAGIYSKDNEVMANSPKDITLRIKNIGDYTAYGIEAYLMADEKYSSLSEDFVRIDKIEPSESILKTVSFSSVKSGRARIECRIVAEDYNVTDGYCETIELLVKEKENFLWLFVALAVVIFSMGVYLYIANKK